MFRSKKEHLCVVCDVGSTSVSAGIVLFRENQKPKILATNIFPISISTKPDILNLEEKAVGFFEKAMFWAAHDGLAVAYKQGVFKNKVEHVCVVLSSPWYVSKTSKVVIDKEKPFELDNELIQTAVKSEENIFEQDVLSGKYESVKGKDIKMIEREVVAVRLNGYETLDPHNKKATNVEFSFFMSVVPMKMVTSMNNLAKKYFHIEEIFFRTFPLCFFNSIKKIYPHESDFILLDVAGESTEVILISKNIIERSASFFSGVNNLRRLVMEKLEVTEEIAYSFLIMNKSGTIEPAFKKELDDLALKDSETWTSSLSNILDSFQKTSIPLPTTCFVVCDQAMLSLFESRIKELSEKYGISHIVAITSDKILDHVEVVKSAKQVEILMIETLFLERHGIGLHN